jgi:CheY-like chemotaxis protein
VDCDSRHQASDPIEVVYVEDDADTLEMMEIALGQYGWVVRSAPSVTAAHELIRGSVPDVVLTDLRIESSDSGWSLAEDLRRDDRTRDLVLVALSGTLRTSQPTQPPFDAMVAKPVDTPSLVGLVTDLVNAKKRAREGTLEQGGG